MGRKSFIHTQDNENSELRLGSLSLLRRLHDPFIVTHPHVKGLVREFIQNLSHQEPGRAQSLLLHLFIHGKREREVINSPEVPDYPERLVTGALAPAILLLCPRANTLSS
jgi:hypothetical protein